MPYATVENRRAAARARYHRRKKEDPEGLAAEQAANYQRRMADPKKKARQQKYAREKMREYREADPEKALEASRVSEARRMADPTKVEAKRKAAREATRRSREKNPRAWRNSRLKSSYGITIDDYESMLKRQRGKCAICRQPETVVSKGVAWRLAVDHCHDSGVVRGLLCSSCNRGLGYLKHNPKVLKSALKYLAGV